MAATWAAAASAVCATVTVAPAQSSTARLLPVDEAATRPDFFSFRAQLQEAVARHDVDARERREKTSRRRARVKHS
jgi:hypothetical protein